MNQSNSAIDKQPVNLQDKLNEKKEKSLKKIDSQKKLKHPHEDSKEKDQHNQSQHSEQPTPLQGKNQVV